nr:probable L-cysteine desulfhydrase, chloroplastic [Tanacetum cinerariifolium]
MLNYAYGAVKKSVEAYVTSGRKVWLAVIDHITSMPSVVIPVKKLVKMCRDEGVDCIFVDVAHAIRSIHVDVEDIGADFYTSNLHKWDYSAQLVVPEALEFVSRFEGGLEGLMKWNHDNFVEMAKILMKAWGTNLGSTLDMCSSMVMIGLPAYLRITSDSDGLKLRSLLREYYKVEVLIYYRQPKDGEVNLVTGRHIVGAWPEGSIDPGGGPLTTLWLEEGISNLVWKMIYSQLLNYIVLVAELAKRLNNRIEWENSTCLGLRKNYHINLKNDMPPRVKDTAFCHFAKDNITARFISLAAAFCPCVLERLCPFQNLVSFCLKTSCVLSQDLLCFVSRLPAFCLKASCVLSTIDDLFLRFVLGPLAKGTEGAPHLGPKRPRVYSDLSLEEKDRYNADIRATNILLQGFPKDIYTLINHYTDAKDMSSKTDKMFLMQAQEYEVELDEEQLLFLTGRQDTTIDEDVDEQPVQDLALNVDNVFQADDCDAFDSDVDEAPT